MRVRARASLHYTSATTSESLYTLHSLLDMPCGLSALGVRNKNIHISN